MALQRMSSPQRRDGGAVQVHCCSGPVASRAGGSPAPRRLVCRPPDGPRLSRTYPTARSGRQARWHERAPGQPRADSPPIRSESESARSRHLISSCRARQKSPAGGPKTAPRFMCLAHRDEMPYFRFVKNMLAKLVVSFYFPGRFTNVRSYWYDDAGGEDGRGGRAMRASHVASEQLPAPNRDFHDIVMTTSPEPLPYVTFFHFPSFISNI
jgi:hypothetical protein